LKGKIKEMGRDKEVHVNNEATSKLIAGAEWLVKD
jgi:hypothetical protein